MIIAQLAPTSTSSELIFTSLNNRQTEVKTITIANIHASTALSYKIYVNPDGQEASSERIVFHNSSLAAGDTDVYTNLEGLSFQKGKGTISVETTQANNAVFCLMGVYK